MAFLTPDKVYTKYGLEISEKILPSHLKPNKKLSNGTGKVEYVTIHNTDDIVEAKGTNDAEQYARATFNGNMGDVVVHYYIDETGCWKLLHDYERGVHAADVFGPGNTTSIAIEIIMDGSGSKSDVAAEDRGALLAAIKLYEHGLDITRLTTHNRWYPRKYCPAFILPHWDVFKKKVEHYLNEIKASENIETDTDDTVEYKYRVQTGAFSVREYAEDFVKTLNSKGFDAFIVEDGDLLRVQIGAFSVRDYAENYVKVLEDAGFESIIIKVIDDDADIPGDVDGDGKISAADARTALRASVGTEKLTAEQMKRTDVDGDGKITASDARDILRKSVGIE